MRRTSSSKRSSAGHPGSRKSFGDSSAMRYLLDWVEQVAIDGCDSPRDRGDRNRKGARRARDPSPFAACKGPVREGELRGDPRDAARVGALRPRARRVHGRHRAAPRTLRAGGRRDGLPRRDWRAPAGHAGHPAARGPGTGVRASGGRAPRESGRPDRSGHQPRSRGRRAGRTIPQRSLLPPQRLPGPRAAASRAARGRAAPRRASGVEVCGASRRTIERVDARGLRALAAYDWPGNVRELENVVERAVILSRNGTLRVGRDVLPSAEVRTSLTNELQSSERKAIETALAASCGRVSGPDGAAHRLGLPASTLEFRIRRLGIDKFQYRR